MSVKQPSLRGLVAWYVLPALVLGAIAAGAAAPPAAATREEVAGQEKGSRDEKKDEKKEEKKGLPLKPDRKIEFSTDEGTWLSLDVSPDGKTIVFELLGDIYTLPIEGGQAKLVDGGMAFDSQPKFSPDGKWIAFLSDREGTENVWIMKADGSEPKQVSKDPNSEFASPSWSPDGQFILYVSRYETETGLRLRNLHTGEDRWVRYPVTRDDQEALFTRDLFPGYAFMPGAKEIVYNQNGKIRRLNLETGAEQDIPFTAKVSVDLGPKLDFPQKEPSGPVKARLIMDPTESPDGKTLAFSAMTHLYTFDLPNGKPQRLTSGDSTEFQPAWSPDGRWIAYVSWNNKGGQLWKISASGGQPQQLSKSLAVYSNPVWSPDSTRIVLLRGNAYDRENSGFDGGQTGNAELVWVPAEGGDAQLILPARGAGGPHFTNEKDRIYVYTPQGLVSLRYDGTDRRTHLVVKGQGVYFFEEPIPADDIQPSPDGQYALAHVMNQLYLMPLPAAAGEAPTVNVLTPSVPVKRVTDIGADYFGWADGGKTITWAVGASYFRQPLDSIKFVAPKEEKKEGEKKEEKKDGRAAKDAEKKDSAAANQEEKKPEKFKEQEKDVSEVRVDLEMPRKTPRGTIVLRGATVVTMKGDEVLKNADIVVENNRIKSVGARSGVPAGAKVFDVGGKTITPGFVDTHAHWFEIRRGILDRQNFAFLANLAYGVTAGLDVQTGTNDMFAYQDLVDISDIIGLRAYSTGPGVFSDNNFQSEQEVAGVLTKYRDYYGTHNIKSYLVGNRKQRQFMVEASKELGMMPTTEGALDLKIGRAHV